MKRSSCVMRYALCVMRYASTERSSFNSVAFNSAAFNLLNHHSCSFVGKDWLCVMRPHPRCWKSKALVTIGFDAGLGNQRSWFGLCKIGIALTTPREANPSTAQHSTGRCPFNSAALNLLNHHSCSFVIIYLCSFVGD